MHCGLFVRNENNVTFGKLVYHEQADIMAQNTLQVFP